MTAPIGCDSCPRRDGRTVLGCARTRARAKALGLYDRDQHTVRKTTVDEIPALVFLSVLYAMTVWLTEAALFQGALNRPQVFALILTSLAGFMAGRLLARRMSGVAAEPARCLIVGNRSDAQRVGEKLDSAPGVKTTWSEPGPHWRCRQHSATVRRSARCWGAS